MRFANIVTNVLRSWDGLTLYAVSSDGTLAAFCFDPDELEGIAPHSIQQQYLQKFGFTLPPLSEGWSHTSLQVPSSGHRITPPPSPNRSSHPPHGLNGFGPPSANIGHEVVNTLIAKRNTKRRAQQQLPGHHGVSNSAVVYANSSPYHLLFTNPCAFSHTSCCSPVFSSGLVLETSQHPMSARPDMSDDRPTKTRTLGGDRVNDSNLNLVKELRSPINQRNIFPGGPGIESKNVFAVPPVLTYLSLQVADAGDDILECKNAESGGEVVPVCFLSNISLSYRALRFNRS